MSSSAYKLIPFFYFLSTRMRRLKDLVFHGLYEFVPAFIILFYLERSAGDAAYQLFFFYLAFISVYEIGYLANDQSAIDYEDERPRSGVRWKRWMIAVFVGIRVLVFAGVSWMMSVESEWYLWFGLLGAVFTLHNLLRDRLMKCVTFSYLAFARFFSPMFSVVLSPMFVILLAPVLVNYVLFRLITYMDSKGLLSGDRKTGGFRIGYYVLLIPFSVMWSILFGSWMPLYANTYFLLLNGMYGVMMALRRQKTFD